MILFKKLYTCLDSLVSGPSMASISTYSRERLNEGCKPARFTHIRENNGEFSAGYDGQTDIGGCFGGQSRTASCCCNKVGRDDHGDQR